jgi:hypothetical protein
MGDNIKPNVQGNQQTNSPADGHNNRRAGGGGRRNRRYQNNNANKNSYNASGFISRNKGIEHDIFDNTGTNDAALFNHSLNQIADYLIEKLDQGKDVSDAIRHITPVVITIPQEPTPLPDPNDSTKTLPDTETMLFKLERFLLTSFETQRCVHFWNGQGLRNHHQSMQSEPQSWPRG